MPLHKLQQGCGFQMAPTTTLGAFRQQAEELKAAFCRSHDVSPPTEASAEAPPAPKKRKGAKPEADGRGVSPAVRAREAQLERCFWRLVRTECEEFIVP